MADAIVSIVLEQLSSFAVQEIKGGISLVMGARKAVNSSSTTLRKIQAVLRDAEERQLKEEAVKIWLDELKDIAYDMEDVLDEWRTSVLKLKAENASIPKRVCSFFLSSCFSFRQLGFRRRISLEIKGISQRLDDSNKENTHSVTLRSNEQPQRVKTTSFLDVSQIYGRDEEKCTLVNKLLSHSNNNVLDIVSIIGMRGIGKTTLAQFACNHNEVKNEFEKIIWVSVSDPFDEFQIAKAIIEAFSYIAPSLSEPQTALDYIRKIIMGKKFLLILDDVWIEDYNRWEPLYTCLKNGKPGSKILITTSKERVAHMMRSTNIIIIRELNEESCWSLFKSLAFFNKSPDEYKKLEGIGKEIVSKCKGLPLAAKIMGHVLDLKKSREEWERVLHSEMWKLKEFEQDLFPTLFLSYKHLSPMEKQCFSYCAIFPKDYNINKDQLIQLWMAQGYLDLAQNKEMELIGQQYCDNLVAQSLLQDLKEDYDSSNIRYKMHDIVHYFTLFLTRNGEEASISNYYHKMLVSEEVQQPALDSICEVKKLRSLLVKCSWDPFDNNRPFPEFLAKFTHLRALGIGMDKSVMIKEVPNGIKKLIHLRYLNLSCNYLLEELPEAVCELYNLQTLDVSRCESLQKLPQKMEKLINLRHLINNETKRLEYMPKGMEKLTCLRTLQEFVVSGNTKACSLDCLQHLSNLHSLGIKGLGYLRDVGEALKNNQNLLSLDLYFEYETKVMGLCNRINENDKVILEALQPPPNLKKLEIRSYGGSTLFPNWMVSLTNLRVLSIVDCVSIEHLPSLGKLSSLEVLNIKWVTKVKSVGKEILGIKSDDTSAIAFPKLKSLTFVRMEQWEEWDYEITKEWDYEIIKKDEKDIIIMPCLRSLHISWCHQLKGIPNSLLQSTTLEKLRLNVCPILKQRCEKETGDYWAQISHIPHIEIS